MTMLTGFFSALFWGVLLLSILVFIHEGGHYLAARATGMRVTEFFLGLPCRIKLSFKSKRVGTEFGVTPFLLGGYNRICGMEGELDELLAPMLAIVQREGRVTMAKVAQELGIDEQRAYTMAATLTEMASIRPYYNPELDEQPWKKEWPEAFETLERDAKLLNEYDRDHDFSHPGTTKAGDPRPVDDPDSFLKDEISHTYRGKGFLARLVTLLAGPLVNIVFALALLVGTLMVGGVQVNANSNVLGSVTEGSYAQAAGLKGGDKIVMLGNKEVNTWYDLCVAIDESTAKGGDVPVTYERDGQTHETVLHLPTDKVVDIVGVNALLETYHLSFGEALSYALSYVQLVGSTVARLIMPQHTMEVVSQSSSVVGISAMASQAAASGLADLVMFAAAISMSLGFTNLLPLPPLDGGKVLLEIVELLRGKPLSAKAQNAVSYVGLAFFLALFCYALFNDVTKIMGI